MKLYELEEKGKERALIYLESYVNSGSPSGFSNQENLGEYAAGRETAVDIPLIRTSYPTLDFFAKNGAAISLMKNGVLPIHPLALKSVENICDYTSDDILKGYVTASGRTLLAESEGKYFFLKLHYPGILGRVNRHLPLRKAIAGVEISNMICDLISSAKLAHIGLLPEIRCGGIVGNGLDESVSYIERSASIFTSNGVDDNSYLIPGFSMFSVDVKAPADELLLWQVCKEFEINTAKKFFDGMIRPLLSDYLILVFSYGLMPEINAQNLLFAFDLPKKKIYPVLRDMGRVEKLLYINSDLASLISCPYKTIGIDDLDYAFKRHSFSFDFKLTQYVFKPLIEAYCQHTQDDPAVIYKLASQELDNHAVVRRWLKKDRSVIGHPKVLLTQNRPYIIVGNPLIE